MPMALQFKSEFIFHVMFTRIKGFLLVIKWRETKMKNHWLNEQTKWAFHLNFVYFHLIGTYHVWKSNNDNGEHFNKIHSRHMYRCLHIVHCMKGTMLRTFSCGIRMLTIARRKPKVVSYNFLSLSSFHFRIWL